MVTLIAGKSGFEPGGKVIAAVATDLHLTLSGNRLFIEENIPHPTRQEKDGTLRPGDRERTPPALSGAVDPPDAEQHDRAPRALEERGPLAQQHRGKEEGGDGSEKHERGRRPRADRPDPLHPQ